MIISHRCIILIKAENIGLQIFSNCDIVTIYGRNRNESHSFATFVEIDCERLHSLCKANKNTENDEILHILDRLLICEIQYSSAFFPLSRGQEEETKPTVVRSLTKLDKVVIISIIIVGQCIVINNNRKRSFFIIMQYIIVFYSTYCDFFTSFLKPCGTSLAIFLNLQRVRFS